MGQVIVVELGLHREEPDKAAAFAQSQSERPAITLRRCHPASLRVNEVHLPARLAAQRLIGLTGLIGPIVRDPALNVKARVWTAEEEWRHSLASQRSQSTP